MARPEKFAGTNKIYRAPPDRDDVVDLHVFANGNVIVSAWRPSESEMEEIIESGVIFLASFSGATLFPALVGSESIVRSCVVDYGAIWKSDGRD